MSSTFSGDDILLYRQVRAVKCGQIERFIVKYTPQVPSLPQSQPLANPIPPNLWLKVKNKESIALRAAYLAGPYVLYVDVTPEAYDSQRQCFITADQPVFEPQLLPGQSVYAELSCHNIKESYVWTVDVVSQTIFNNTIDVDFEISIGTSKKVLHDLSFPNEPPHIENSDKCGTFISPTILSVKNHDTLDLWNLPLPAKDKPIHLVILTHGLHSNVSADMLFLKEEINKHTSGSSTGENVVVKGFFGNVCKTERGIKYLGSRVAEFVIDLLTKNDTFNNGKTTKISFIGHSLGGLVQTFAIAYIANNFPWVFKAIKPVNFITISSPLLGVVHENPIYVKLALSAGIVGKTGQDLGLVFLEGDSTAPLLLLLPTGPTHKVLKAFKRRTVYANIKNDGIVPLRTSALLYLDYKGVMKVMASNNDTKNDIESDQGGESGGTTKIPNSETLDSAKDSSSNALSPVQAMLSFFMPQKQSSGSSYQKFQTGGGYGAGEVDTSRNDEGTDENVMGRDSILSKSSVLETATSLILPPLPSFKYITDPRIREDVIVHDKVYYEKDIPPRVLETTPTATPSSQSQQQLPQPSSSENSSSLMERLRGMIESPIAITATSANPNPVAENAEKVPPNTTSPSLRKRLLKSLDNIEYLEEEIAREYHKHMSWRKVLVSLRPDAHNNIIVRRRYANAYGWPVIAHLVANHFEVKDYEAPAKPVAMETDDSLDNELDLSRILSRDLISKENEKLDDEVNDEDEAKKRKIENHWINSKDDSESMFAVGPAGLLSDVSEMMGQMRDHWYNYGTSKDQEEEALLKRRKDDVSNGAADKVDDESSVSQEMDSKKGDLGLSNQIMGDFI